MPVIAERQWGGHVAAVGTGLTKVTLINDIESNPPARTTLKVNEDVNVGDVLLINNLGLDAGLSVWQGVELFLDGSMGGFRWQFLNHGANENVWVGAIHGAYGERTASTSSTNSGVESKATSKVKTSQAGISLGYKFRALVPYFSYIHEAAEVSTDVTNGAGHFGAYADNGTHENYSLGLSSFHQGFRYAIEYNVIHISWDRAARAYQNAAGVKLGFSW